jgi:ribosomal protein L10
MVAPKPSGFANTKQGKAVIIERTKKLLDSSAMVITFPAEGITKENVDILKKALPKTTKASVVKNSLMKKAVEGTSYEAMVASGPIKNQNIFFFFQ